ncbi:hypothetical protein KKD19_00325 [Patescibacteria group bacterium]|nr:hypothetical protein [Patescibacteria group bacterium]MBU4511677.1 hypothetical protein [Patescibacteria group bacterium]
MAEVSVVNTIGKGKAWASICIEGNLSKANLKKRAMESVGLSPELLSHLCDIEVRDVNKYLTRRIASDCTIFIVSSSKPSEGNPFDDLFGDFFKR